MSRVDLIRFPFELEAYPRPRVRALPQMDIPGLARMLAGGRKESPFNRCQCFVRARYAQFHSLARAGVGPGDGVLAPAYHCRTMIEPIIRAGADPVLYRVGADLRPDVEHIEMLLSSYAGRIRCLLLPHYFGFAQSVDGLLPLLERQNVILIEDCAHVMTPGPGSGGPGRQGDFAIFCPAKLWPCPDGGVLWTAPSAPGHPQPQNRKSAGGELRLLLRMLEGALRRPQSLHGRASRPSLPNPGGHDGGHAIERNSIDTEAIRAGRIRTYIPALESTSCSLWSSRILRTADAYAIAESRRRNFRRWLMETETLSDCWPLIDKLDGDTVPYMFPLVLNDPNRQFDALKRLGMPMYRWDELAVSDCANASRYRLSLVHLPCHQDLDEAAMEQMVAMLRDGIGAVRGRESMA